MVDPCIVEPEGEAAGPSHYRTTSNVRGSVAIGGIADMAVTSAVEPIRARSVGRLARRDAVATSSFRV
jgi:hypothetical protein